MTTDNPKESLLKFPCDFTLKVFGLHTKDFETTVYHLVRQHVPSLSMDAIQSRPSENGKYCALSILVHAESKEQLDNIYQALSASSHVLMAL